MTQLVNSSTVFQSITAMILNSQTISLYINLFLFLGSFYHLISVFCFFFNSIQFFSRIGLLRRVLVILALTLVGLAVALWPSTEWLLFRWATYHFLCKWSTILPLFIMLVFGKNFSLAGRNAGLGVLGVLGLHGVVMTHLPIGHINRTHDYLMSSDNPSVCPFCNTIVPLFVLHLFVGCNSLSVIRRVFFPSYIIIPFRNPPIFIVTPFLLFFGSWICC